MRALKSILLLCIGCGQGEPSPTPSGDVSIAAAVAPASEPTPDADTLLSGSSGWYDRSRVLDVTGDGLPDTLRLIARGTRADSLVVTLLVHTHGDSSMLAAWQSDYDFVDPPEELKSAGPARDSTLRSRYDRVLRQATVATYRDSTLSMPWTPSSPFLACEDNAHHCIMVRLLQREHPRVRIDSLEGLPFDTAAASRVVADLASRNVVSLTYSYGYESTETVVWSPLLRDFILVFACC